MQAKLIWIDISFYDVVLSDFTRTISHNKNTEINVKGVKTTFSKIVFANKFPIVFNANKQMKNQIIPFMYFPGILCLKKFPFNKSTVIKNELTKIDIDSKAYMSSIDCNFPAQTISYGII